MSDNPFEAPAASTTAPIGNQFPTRFGTCTVHKQGITLVNDSPRGRISSWFTGRSMWSLRVAYAVINIGAMVTLVTGFLSGGDIDPFIPFIIAYTAFALWRTMDHTRDMEISRDEIQQVKAFAGTRFLTVPVFEARYTRDGTALKRRIQLPGVLFARAEDFEAAKKVFVDAGMNVT